MIYVGKVSMKGTGQACRVDEVLRQCCCHSRCCNDEVPEHGKLEIYNLGLMESQFRTSNLSYTYTVLV